MEELEKSSSSDTDGRLMGLPETESELDNLTEFNTAHNRRITMIGIFKIMAIGVVEFPNGVYKIRKIFAQKSTYPKEIIEF